MWLLDERDRLLAMAGFPVDTAHANDAIAFAQQSIERYTGRTWDAVAYRTARIRLTARSYVLPLPAGMIHVTTVNGQPKPTGTQWRVGSIGLEAVRNNQLVPWQPGVYEVVGGSREEDVPTDVLKAAALLINYYLRLSDAERSRFVGYSRGDFSGTMRFSELPVPEAETLLAPYARRATVELI